MNAIFNQNLKEGDWISLNKEIFYIAKKDTSEMFGDNYAIISKEAEIFDYSVFISQVWGSKGVLFYDVKASAIEKINENTVCEKIGSETVAKIKATICEWQTCKTNLFSM